MKAFPCSLFRQNPIPPDFAWTAPCMQSLIFLLRPNTGSPGPLCRHRSPPPRCGGDATAVLPLAAHPTPSRGRAAIKAVLEGSCPTQNSSLWFFFKPSSSCPLPPQPRSSISGGFFSWPSVPSQTTCQKDRGAFGSQTR